MTVDNTPAPETETVPQDGPENAGHITWRDGDVPFSPHFGDIYYNPGDGLAETRYVFLEGNNLPAAWQDRDNFAIGETGFGTGLNFLAAWQAWDQDPQRSQRLHFVSVEKYPLSRRDMTRAHQSWPELAEFSAQLGAVWPEEPMLPGIHRFVLSDGMVTLTLLIGDALECWTDYEGSIDCWFLDGFAPSRNPDMWHPSLLAALAAASSPDGATLATFTAARIARDGLESAGFEVSKRKGFGRKRDMIVATLPAREPSTALAKISDDPWFRLPTPSSVKSVAVIGGGMAGAACANALRKRGCQVVLFEKRDQLASAASGNPIGMLEPYFTVDRAIIGRFYEAGFRYSHHLIRQLTDKGLVEAGFCGVLDLITSDRQRIRQEGLMARLPDRPDLVCALSRTEAGAVFGRPVPAGGLFYPTAGWVNPPSLVRALAKGIECRFGTEIIDIRDEQSRKVLITRDGAEAGPFDAVVIAGATETTKASQTRWLADHLQAVRGQISYFPEALAEDAPLRCVLNHKGYITPVLNGQHVFGATFGRDDDQTDLRQTDHAFNITQLGKVLPDIAAKLSADHLDGRAAVRTTTVDHLPIVGPAPDFEGFLQAYHDIDKGRKGARYIDAPCHKDVYICTGFGARGLIAAPLAAEVIASEICAMPLPLEKALMHALHPARFIIRGLKRQKIKI